MPPMLTGRVFVGSEVRRQNHPTLAQSLLMDTVVLFIKWFFKSISAPLS